MPAPLYLTFDDGPDPDWTPRVVEALGRHRAQGTFFVLGWRIRERPSMIGDLLRAGHRVEFHGDAHLDHELATAEQLEQDTGAALTAMAAAGAVPQWWRLPYGRAGVHSAALAERHGLRLIGWDADTYDWRGDAWAAQPEPVRAAAERGGVVLMHDAVGPGVPRTDAENTLELVHRLLDAADLTGTPALALPDAATTDAFTTQAGPPPEPIDALDDQAAMDRFAVDAAGVALRNIAQ